MHNWKKKKMVACHPHFVLRGGQPTLADFDNPQGCWGWLGHPCLAWGSFDRPRSADLG